MTLAAPLHSASDGASGPTTCDLSAADWGGDTLSNRYKIGDAFFNIPLEQAQEMLATSNSQAEEDIAALEDRLSSLRDEMSQLKVHLYARFGRSINLET